MENLKEWFTPKLKCAENVLAGENNIMDRGLFAGS